MSLLLRPIFVVLIVFAAPVLASIAALGAEYGSVPTDVVVRPMLYSVCAIFSYAIAAKVSGTRVEVLRIILFGSILYLLIFLILSEMYFYFMFIGQYVYEGVKLYLTIYLSVLALAFSVLVSVFIRSILRSEVPIVLELSALFLFFILTAYFGTSRKLPDKVTISNLYSAYPLISGLVPLAFAALCSPNERFRLGRGLIWLVISVAPIYLLITVSGSNSERGIDILWPKRLVTEFMPGHQRIEILKSLQTVEPGKPVRIGEHWYVFDALDQASANANQGLRLDHLVLLDLELKPSVLGLADAGRDRQGNPENTIRLFIRVPQDNKSVGAFSRKSPGIIYEDLLIVLGRPAKDPGWPTNEVLEARLRDFIEKARIEPPEDNPLSH